MWIKMMWEYWKILGGVRGLVVRSEKIWDVSNLTVVSDFVIYNIF